MGFGHIGEILLLLVLALIVFGPKRMIEMVSQLGKALIQTRDALRGMNWNPMADAEDAPASSTAVAHDHLRVVESEPPAEQVADDQDASKV